MADINALLAQGVSLPQIESPVNQFARLQALRSAQQEQQLNALKLQEAQTTMGQQEALRNYLAGATDYTSPEFTTGLTKFGAPGLAVAKGLSEQATAELTRKKTQAELTKAQSELVASKTAQARQMLEGIDPNDPNAPALYNQWLEAVHKDEVLGPTFDNFGATLESSKARLQAALAQPGGFANLLNESKLGADKFATHVQQQATAAETHRHNVAMEDVSRDRADAYTSHMKDLGLNSKSYPNLAQAIADGRLSPTRVNSRNAGILENVLEINPEADLNQFIRSAISSESGARSLGTTLANQSAAGEEAATMIPIARQYANLVKAGQFKTLNDFSNFAGKQTGDTSIVRLNTALNSLVNSYARAINPKGVATVSDKNHAREVLDAGLSKGQLNATLDVMEQEIAAARAGTETARTAVISGKPTTTAPTTSGDLKALATSAFGSYDTTKFDYRINPSTGKVQRKAK